MNEPIAIYGFGAFGTALAMAYDAGGLNVRLVGRSADQAQKMLTTRKNTKYLDGFPLRDTVQISSELSSLTPCPIVLVAVPTQSLNTCLQTLCPFLQSDTILVLCAKGLEASSGAMVAQIATQYWQVENIAVLSGPGFAKDIAKGLPTAMTLAAHDEEMAARLAQVLSTPKLRLYSSSDMIGVQVGGALKNVLALGVGIARGKGLGASAEAALTTRAFAEMTRYAVHFGAERETLSGLSGLGDLLLTTSSPQSRNFAYGYALGAGAVLPDKLAEGVHTTEIAVQMAQDNGLETPIMNAVKTMLDGSETIEVVMETLLSRPLKREAL